MRGAGEGGGRLAGGHLPRPGARCAAPRRALPRLHRRPAAAGLRVAGGGRGSCRGHAVPGPAAAGGPPGPEAAGAGAGGAVHARGAALGRGARPRPLGHRLLAQSQHQPVQTPPRIARAFYSSPTPIATSINYPLLY